MSNYLKVKVQ